MCSFHGRLPNAAKFFLCRASQGLGLGTDGGPAPQYRATCINLIAGLVLAAVAGSAIYGPVAAQEPAAIVENVDAQGAGLAVMDFVMSGRVIELGKNGTLTLGYLRSCIMETIVGGRVIVGSQQSEVHGGKIKRERTECDGAGLELTEEESGRPSPRLDCPGPGCPGRTSPNAKPIIR
jgi:hypothetical protein